MSSAPRTVLRCFFLFLCALGLAQTLSAVDASSALTGRVINSATGAPVAGATVALAGGTRSATTDLNGAFRITGVAAGSHDVTVEKASFQPLTVSGVTLDANRSEDIELPLSPSVQDIVKMVAFSVSADAVTSSDVGLLGARQKAPAVSDAIGAEQFSRLSAGNAAEALSRIAGGSVVDGKYVLIRGLGDRYANTLLNGVAIPSADPEKRAVQMDQFPSELLESIVTTKSFTPDQPGAFSGGSVNLKTKSFPDHFFVSVQASVEGNTAGTRRSLLRAPGLDAVPELPAAIPNRTAAELAARTGNLDPAQMLDRATRAFGTGPIYPRKKRTGADVGYGGAIGNRHAFGETGVFGYTATLTHERDFSHTTDGAANRFIGTADAVQPKLVLSSDRRLLSFDPASALPAVPDFGVTSSTETESVGGFAKLALQPNLDHEVTLDLLFNATTDDTVRRGVGEEANNYAGNVFEVYDLLKTERSVRSAQLGGKSLLLGLRDLQLEWRGSFARSTQDQPDYRTLSAIYDLDGTFQNATGVQPNRFFRELQEDATEGAVDVTYPVHSSARREYKLKTGVLASRSERTYAEQRFQYQGNPSSLAQLHEYPGPVGIVGQSANAVTFGRTIARLQEPNNYTGEQRIAAAYAMADVNITDRWRTIFGLRYEQTTMETVPVRAPGFTSRDGRLDQAEMLPAFSAVYAPTAKTNWRFAYGRTLARPTFKELTDIRYEDVFTGDTYLGNPALELTVVDNFDARWEWFPRRSETIAVSAFYKQLDRPIEVLFQPGVGSIQPANVEEGTVYGVEFEFRRGLGFVAPSLEEWSVGANLALIHSEVTIPAAELAVLRAFKPDASDRRELLGQSPYTFNFDVTYSRRASSTTATLSFNVVGERLDLVNYGPLPDVYEQPAPLLNLIVSQRLSERWRLKFSARNLLDPDREKTIAATAGDYTWSRVRTGRSFAVGVTYLFE